MTDTPVPYEFPSPAAPAHPAENTEVTGVAGLARATGALRTAERAKTAGAAKTVGAIEAARPPVEDDDLVIEDLSDTAWSLPAPGICICTVAAE
ncbi:hypothetical protein VT50_0221035 [Streptomyces antioxidans]|uniref:Uncharacterized protein n=1 Tax=Streptomyces antioxidans TaxID=1507734 RepID=A0A1V4D2B5_9ACTN|nr:hypothetical protein [Streptomyces antioxidans]OPF77765.1 hypothetical protein VT50_0221035 [Streptomyces antioxidans]